jgi:hypothetical protein
MMPQPWGSGARSHRVHCSESTTAAEREGSRPAQPSAAQRLTPARLLCYDAAH